MMSADLDVLAREASAAARTSVAAAAADAAREAPRRARTGRRALLAATSLVVAAGVVAGAVSRGGDTTSVTTLPAGRPEQTTALPAPSPNVLPAAPTLGGGPPIGAGTTSTGLKWELSIGGPSNELCLRIFLDERNGTGACAGRPGGAPSPEDERHLPLLLDESRAPRHVFGRVPADIREVQVELASGERTPPHPTIQSGPDAYYAMELKRNQTPKAVLATRRDGTTLRLPLRG